MSETTIAVQEKPILFSGPMVRAILDGSKTQTRRVVKPQPSEDWNPEVGVYAPTRVDRHGEEYPGADVFGASDENEGRVFPYGQPGDRLWVRETWASPETKLKLPGRVAYNADGEAGAFMGDGGGGYIWLHHGRILEAEGYQQCFPKNGSHTYGLKKFGGRWRPSIHMPRWASRLTLEIFSVKVERVQDISEEDARAEGVTGSYQGYNIPDERHKWHQPCRASFSILWDSINSKRDGGKYAWEKNPWAWAISFKRVQG